MSDSFWHKSPVLCIAGASMSIIRDNMSFLDPLGLRYDGRSFLGAMRLWYDSCVALSSLPCSSKTKDSGTGPVAQSVRAHA